MGLQVRYGFGCVGFTAPVSAPTLIGAFCFMHLLYVSRLRIVKLDSLSAYVYNGSMAKRIPKDIRAYFSKLGKKGGKKGGAVRASNMTPGERSESARKAVTARWQRVKATEESAD